MIALGVLGIGMSFLFAMITQVSTASRSLEFQTHAANVFAEVSAEIRDARCDHAATIDNGTVDPAMTDPGLASVVGDGWVTAPVAGSLITLIGDGDTNARLADYVPKI